MRIPRVMIAATKSGSGKTLLTCGLLAAFKETYKVQAIKCGPDYIDPMFHRSVLGVPSKNLDTYFTGEGLTRELFARSAREAKLAVFEGVMGLYDGLGGVRREGSSYHLAQVTKTPVILLADAHGMGKSVLALLRGFLDYDRDHLICGVILNRISKTFYETIKPEIERELPVPVLGFLPRLADLSFESRHLGLVLPQELPGLRRQLSVAADAVREHIALEKIEAIAQRAPDLEVDGTEEKQIFPDKAAIGVARDEAFCFYYEDNLRCLEDAGAKLVSFSPLHDGALPKGVCGLMFGGGYPELYAKRLSENDAMRAAVRNAADAGMPILAECGGFLYLHESMEDMEKHTYPMAGVIRAHAYYTGKSVRFGYVKLREKDAAFLPEGAAILGHEFHYYDSTDNGSDCVAAKAVTGKSWDCVHKTQNRWMGFAHLYYPSQPAFAKYFVGAARAYKNGGGTP